MYIKNPHLNSAHNMLDTSKNLEYQTNQSSNGFDNNISTDDNNTSPDGIKTIQKKKPI